MEFLKKIWDAISGLFGGSDISLKSKKEVRKNVIKGENNGPIINGNVDKSIVTGSHSNVRVGADIQVSKEEPSDQEEGGLWLREVE